jgi:FixJ family two-component response regulator
VTTQTPRPQTPAISSRDREILNHLVAAPDQRTAAEWLGMTDRHLRRRIDSIMKRMEVETVLQLVALATLNGMISPKALPAGSVAHKSRSR